MESPKSTETMITGRKGSIGPALPRPSSSLPQPHWKIATTTPKDGGDGGDVHHGGLERDADRAEGEQQQQAAQADDDADEQRQLADDDLGEVVVARRHPADVHLERGAASRRAGSDLVAQPVDEVAGLPADCGEVVGYDGEVRRCRRRAVRSPARPTRRPRWPGGSRRACRGRACRRRRRRRRRGCSGPLTPGPKPSASRS